MLPKHKLTNTKNDVKNREYLSFYFKKSNIFGSISSSAMALIILGALDIVYRAAPILDSIIPIDTTQVIGQATYTARITSLFNKASLVPTAPNRIIKTKYIVVVERWAITVPFGMDLAGSRKSWELFAPAKIQVQVLKNIACNV